MKQKTFYFDYAAATPLDPAVRKAMARFEERCFGNPGSLHRYGQDALRGIDAARERIAQSIGAEFREVVFTGSATEANNLALRGVVAAYRRLTQIKTRINADKIIRAKNADKPHIVISAIEHESVRETAKDLAQQGVDITCIGVDSEGVIDVEALKNALTERTVLVSVMYVNNEVGTIQPIAEIAKIIQGFRVQGFPPEADPPSAEGSRVRHKQRRRLYPNPSTPYPLLHTDAVQAFQYLDCNVETLGVDLMTLSAHKIYGPKGVGALYVRNSKHEARNTKQIQISKSKYQNVSNFPPEADRPLADDIRISSFLSPIVTGGGQEYGLRSGTPNSAGIVGFGKAMELAATRRDKEKKRVTELREYAFALFEKLLPGSIMVNGSRSERIPNNINIYCKGKDAGDMLVWLDRKGIAVSTGPACAARTGMPSEVLRAMGFSADRVKGSLRITLGRKTTRREIDILGKALLQLYTL